MTLRSKISKSDFLEIMKKGGIVRGRFLFVRYKNNNTPVSRFSVVVSSKVSKSAVKRNKIKRIIKGVLASDKIILGNGYDMIISVKASVPIRELKSDLTDIKGKLQTKLWQ